MNPPSFFVEHAQAFLRHRGITTDWLRTLVREQGFDDAQLLLTSSPVHGIATATSDIDLICITPQPVSRGQMATQIHRDGQHCEVLPVQADALALAWLDLHALATQALPERLAGWRRWDDTHTLRRKHLERIVCGVDMDGATPYLDHLSDLVPVVAVQDHDAFHQSRTCAVLARHAGQWHACRGHLMNACLAAMAAALSLGGWVLSNKKWTLRRWREAALPGATVVEPALHAQIGACWAALMDSPHGWPPVDALDGIGAQLAARLGASSAVDAALGQPHAATPVGPVVCVAMDRRSQFLIGADGRAHLARVPGPLPPLPEPADPAQAPVPHAPIALHWFPRIAAGYRCAADALVTASIGAAWLLMTELQAYIEDLRGAREMPEVASLVRIKVAELLLQVDATLARAEVPDEMHRLPLLMQHGIGEVIAMDGPGVARLLGLARPADAAEVDRLVALLEDLIEAFPCEPIDALQPGNQGQVLRFLRSAHKACAQVRCDTAFLVPLMTSL